MLRSYAFYGSPMNHERFWQTTKVVMNSKVKGYASVVVNQFEDTCYFKVKGEKKIRREREKNERDEGKGSQKRFFFFLFFVEG